MSVPQPKEDKEEEEVVDTAADVADTEEVVVATRVVEEVVKNATNVVKTDTLLVTALRVALAVTVAVEVVAAMAEAMEVAVVEAVTLEEEAEAKPVILAVATVICLVIAPKVRSATTVSLVSDWALRVLTVCRW